MKTILFAVLFVCPPVLKPFLLRWFCGARIGRHVYIGWFASLMGRHISIGDYSEIRALTLLRCDGDISIGLYSLVSSFNLIYGSASLTIGNHSYIGPQSLINVDEDVQIGSYSALGARCMVFTHGSFLPYTEGYWVKFGRVRIGDYVWCAAGVFIHPGVEIGDNVFVNSRSVVTESAPSGEILEGFPAKRVTTMDKLQRKMSPKRLDAILWQMLKHFADVSLRRGLGITVGDELANQLRFMYGDHNYLVLCIPSQGPLPTLPDAQSPTRLICLVNNPNWQAPLLSDPPLIFDFATMQTLKNTDIIHHKLNIFFKRYYGVQFEYE